MREKPVRTERAPARWHLLPSGRSLVLILTRKYTALPGSHGQYRRLGVDIRPEGWVRGSACTQLSLTPLLHMIASSVERILTGSSITSLTCHNTCFFREIPRTLIMNLSVHKHPEYLAC